MMSIPRLAPCPECHRQPDWLDISYCGRLYKSFGCTHCLIVAHTTEIKEDAMKKSARDWNSEAFMESDDVRIIRVLVLGKRPDSKPKGLALFVQIQERMKGG